MPADPTLPVTTPIMTPEEFARRMRQQAEVVKKDLEMAHERADDLMCELLRSLGYGEGVAIFEEMDRWYG